MRLKVLDASSIALYHCLHGEELAEPSTGDTDMKLFFPSRSKARDFASKAARSAADQGTSAPAGRRWAVDVAPKQSTVTTA